MELDWLDRCFASSWLLGALGFSNSLTATHDCHLSPILLVLAIDFSQTLQQLKLLAETLSAASRSLHSLFTCDRLGHSSLLLSLLAISTASLCSGLADFCLFTSNTLG